MILSGKMNLRYMGWPEAADLIIKGLGGAIGAREVTYDFEYYGVDDVAFVQAFMGDAGYIWMPAYRIDSALECTLPARAGDRR